MDLEETDPQTDPNIRFRALVRGWSNKNQQARARTLLALSDHKMAKALRHKQDIILIPRQWWSASQDTLGPEEPGWWCTVSDVIYFQECRACEKRLGKDHQRNYTEPDSDDADMLEDQEEMQPSSHLHIHSRLASGTHFHRAIPLSTGASSHRPGERMVTEVRHGSFGSPYRSPTITSTGTLGTRSTSTISTPTASDHGFEHQNHAKGRFCKRTTSKIRKRTGLGPNTAKVLTMGRTHTGLTHYYVQGLDHCGPPKSGMDHREWNLAHPKSEMGTDIGNITENLRLFHNSTATRDSPYFYPHKTHLPDNQANLAGRRNTWTTSNSSAHLLLHGL